MSPCGYWAYGLFGFRAPRWIRRKPQCLGSLSHVLVAQRLSVFSTGLTGLPSTTKVGWCANRIRIACGAGPLGGQLLLVGDTY